MLNLRLNTGLLHLLFIDAYLLAVSFKIKNPVQTFLLQHEFLFSLKRILLILYEGTRFTLFKLQLVKTSTLGKNAVEGQAAVWSYFVFISAKEEKDV